MIGKQVRFYSEILHKWIEGTVVRKWKGTDRYVIFINEPLQPKYVYISKSNLWFFK